MPSLKRPINHSLKRAEQAEQKADEAVMLQDEVDYLREKADQATRLQAAVDSFKKKLDGMKAIKDRVSFDIFFENIQLFLIGYRTRGKCRKGATGQGRRATPR